MSELLKTCQGRDALLAALGSVPVPERTRSWCPASYVEVATHVDKRVCHRMGGEPVSRKYGLSQKGQQVFITWTFPSSEEDMGICIGVRQSYNRTVSLGLVTGLEVYACENMAFDASSMRVTRKNTPQAWSDFVTLTESVLDEIQGDFASVRSDARMMQAVPISTDRGAELIGLALFRGVLATQQGVTAGKVWRDPSTEAFAPRNLWNLYNAFTAAIKHGPAGKVMDRHASAHGFFQKVVEGLPMDVLGPAMDRVNAGEIAV